jgi:hypothetical protein
MWIMEYKYGSSDLVHSWYICTYVAEHGEWRVERDGTVCSVYIRTYSTYSDPIAEVARSQSFLSDPIAEIEQHYKLFVNTVKNHGYYLSISLKLTIQSTEKCCGRFSRLLEYQKA